MWKDATGICRYETTNCENSITLESELVLRPSTTFSSHVLTGRRQRSAFSDRSPGRCLPRYWSQSRSPRLPSVRRDEYWDRLKRCRVADAVIKARYRLQKQQVPPRQTDEVIAVRSTKLAISALDWH